MLKHCRTLLVLTAAVALLSWAPAYACPACDAHKAEAAEKAVGCPHAKEGQAPCADCPHAAGKGGEAECPHAKGEAVPEDCPCKKAAQEQQKL